MAKHTFSGNGNSPVLATGKGGPVTISAIGDFGGGTVKVQYSRDAGLNWIEDSEISWTAANIEQVTLPDGIYLRFNLSGATAPDVIVEV